MKRVEYLNTLPFWKRMYEVLKIALNLNIRIRDFKSYLDEEQAYEKD